MNITTSKERILIIKDQLSTDDALAAASKKRMAAFGAINQMTSLFSNPKDDDFELVYSEHRYEPFWHVAAHARYVFDRTATYDVRMSDETVESVTFLKNSFTRNTTVTFSLPVVEHCRLEESVSVCTDAVTGKEQSYLSNYLSFTSDIVKTTIEKTMNEKSILVPPTTRVSGIVRETLAKLIKGIQADTITEEQVVVDAIDLYYHPVYAFEYRWKSKGKNGIVQVDGCTSAVTTGQRTFAEFMGKRIDTNFLFDIGADAAGIFIPGGSIAVKVAKKYIDTKRGK